MDKHLLDTILGIVLLSSPIWVPLTLMLFGVKFRTPKDTSQDTALASLSLLKEFGPSGITALQRDQEFVRKMHDRGAEIARAGLHHRRH